MTLLVALPLVAAPGPSHAEPHGIPGASGTLWVTERTPSASTVTAFDAATGEVLGTTPVGPAPIGITQPSGTDKVYTSDENADQLSVIAKDTITVIDTIPMGDRPHHLMASRNGNLIYVAEFNSNKIGVVDTSLDARVAGFTASANPAAQTHAVWITRDGKNLYATNAGPANTIAKLDAVTGELIWELPIGNNPSEILVTPDGKTAYVSMRGEHRVKVVDVSGTLPVVTGFAEAQREPDTLSLTNDGKTLVVGLRASPTGLPARMALIDTGTLVTTYVELPGHTTTGHQWLSANGHYTFIGVESPGAVDVVDNRAATRVQEYPYPGGTRPHGVFYEPSERR
ncbi:MAG: YncE family protein [Actinomycetota bacterium]